MITIKPQPELGTIDVTFKPEGVKLDDLMLAAHFRSHLRAYDFDPGPLGQGDEGDSVPLGNSWVALDPETNAWVEINRDHIVVSVEVDDRLDGTNHVTELDLDSRLKVAKIIRHLLSIGTDGYDAAAWKAQAAQSEHAS